MKGQCQKVSAINDSNCYKDHTYNWVIVSNRNGRSCDLGVTQTPMCMNE